MATSKPGHTSMPVSFRASVYRSSISRAVPESTAAKPMAPSLLAGATVKEANETVHEIQYSVIALLGLWNLQSEEHREAVAATLKAIEQDGYFHAMLQGQVKVINPGAMLPAKVWARMMAQPYRF